MQDPYKLPYVKSRFVRTNALTMEVTKAFNGGSSYLYIGKVNTASQEVYIIEDTDLLYVMLLTYEAFINYGD